MSADHDYADQIFKILALKFQIFLN